MASEPTPFTFDILDLFSDAWAIYRAHWLPYAIASLLVLIMINATGYFFIAGILLSGPLVMGLFKMALCGVRGEPVYLGDGFSGFDHFIPAVFLNLLVLFFSLFGAPFCLLPAFYVFVLGQPAYFFLLDDGEGIWAALSRTWEMVRPRMGGWLLVATYVLLLVAAGFFPLMVIGLVLTVPLSIISLALLYDRYRGHAPIIPEPE